MPKKNKNAMARLKSRPVKRTDLKKLAKAKKNKTTAKKTKRSPKPASKRTTPIRSIALTLPTKTPN